VYPAASLMHYVRPETKIYYIDPNPAIASNEQVSVIKETATKGMNLLKTQL
jgi:NAD-dependent deacetylase